MQPKLDEVEVREAWRQVFGQAVENRTRKIHLQKDGTLICMLDSGPLKEEFQHGKREIVDRLNEHLGREVVQQVRIL